MGTSLRPTLTDSNMPCMKNGTAYLLIYRAVADAKGLVHGHLHDGRESCAIGSYFNQHRNTSLPNALINEVAAVNDSLPTKTPLQRKRAVMKWLRWRLNQLDMPI